jgi:hypothetical protein
LSGTPAAAISGAVSTTRGDGCAGMLVALRVSDASLFFARAREEKAADLVLQIAADADRAGTRHEEGADRLAFIALNADLSVAANPNELGKAASIVWITLVHPYG